MMCAPPLITGANRGIGLALVQQFTSRGDRVIAACRHSSEALNATGAQVETGVDVRDARSSHERPSSPSQRLSLFAIELVAVAELCNRVRRTYRVQPHPHSSEK